MFEVTMVFILYLILRLNKICFFFFFFFFSSRRRHTRCSRDWSSDVCSSDLAKAKVGILTQGTPEGKRAAAVLKSELAGVGQGDTVVFEYKDPADGQQASEIGRASCRERV